MDHMSEAEIDLALAVQQAQLEAKVSLADHEVAYQGTRAQLVAQVEATTKAREHAVEAILRARGLNPSEWTLNVATQQIEPAGAIETGLLVGLGEMPEQSHGRPFRHLSSDLDLERERSGAVAQVRLVHSGNQGGSDEAL